MLFFRDSLDSVYCHMCECGFCVSVYKYMNVWCMLHLWPQWTSFSRRDPFHIAWLQINLISLLIFCSFVCSSHFIFNKIPNSFNWHISFHANFISMQWKVMFKFILSEIFFQSVLTHLISPRLYACVRACICVFVNYLEKCFAQHQMASKSAWEIEAEKNERRSNECVINCSKPINFTELEPKRVWSDKWRDAFMFYIPFNWL